MQQPFAACVISTDGRYLPLRRRDFADKRIMEESLQKLLHTAPQVLPVEEFDPSFAPLISLGREVDGIDNLFISPTGRLIVVETKLWRNPEATREVVAQLLDYATRLSGWDYETLQKQIRDAEHPVLGEAETLCEYVAQHCPEERLDSRQFIDEVQKNLRLGRFLLLVVGDGIREGVRRMLDGLHKYPHLFFAFGLVEMQLYELAAQESGSALAGTLVVPRVVARTTEIERAVVRVQTTGPATVSVQMEESESDKPRVRQTLSEKEFLEAIESQDVRSLYERLLLFAEDIGAVRTWRSSGVSIQLPDPGGSRQNLTLFVMSTGGLVYPGWLAGQLERVSADPRIAHDYVKTLVRIFPGVQPSPNNPDSLSRYLTATEVAGGVSEFMEAVREVAVKIRAARSQAPSST